MTTLTRTQTVFLNSVISQTTDMEQELARLKANNNRVPESMKVKFDRNIRDLESMLLDIQHNLNEWQGRSSDPQQITRQVNAFNETMNKTVTLLRENSKTGELGWVEGMAESLQQRTEGWAEGIGRLVDNSEGWTEGMGKLADNSEGWTEGMTK